MAEFTFLRPWWLLALAPLALLVIGLWRQPAGRARWRGIVDDHLQHWALIGASANRATRLPYVLLGLGWMLATIALAGPAWEKLPQPVHRKTDALVLVLDLSASMYAQDLKPSRLQRARLKLRDVLARRTEGQTALVAFAGDAFVVTPFSDDVHTLENQLRQLDPGLMPVPGSHVGRAIETASALIRNAGMGSARILLVTDGLGAQEHPQTAAALAEVPIDLLAVGTAAGDPIPLPDGGFLRDTDGSIVVASVDQQALRTLASESGGRYAQLRADDTDLEYLLSAPLRANDTEALTGRGFDQYREEGPWLLLLLLPLAAMAWRRGWLLSVVLLVGVLPPQPAQAMDLDALWRTPDQRAAEAFANGDFEGAAKQFQHPAWAGSALYRDGAYDAAAEAFARLQTPQAQYNRGNALAKAGRLQEALAAYEQALAMEPEFEDARYNLDQVRKALEEQQQQSQDSPEQGENGNEGRNQQQPGPAQDQGSDPDQNQAGSQETESQASTDQATHDGSQDQPQPGQEKSSSQQQPADDQAGESSSAGQQDEKAGPEPAQELTDRDTQADETNAISQEQDTPRRIDPELAEQLLRRVPDDAGGLLRHKFLYQYQQRENRPTRPEQTW